MRRLLEIFHNAVLGSFFGAFVLLVGVILGEEVPTGGRIIEGYVSIYGN